MSCPRAFNNARRSLRVDYDENRPVQTHGYRQMASHCSRNAADARLHEDVGGRFAQLSERLADKHRVTLHDKAGYTLIAGP
ncbi:hypothetical protein D3C87_1783780 [compost metagenome]